MMKINEITEQIIGGAMEVHKALGPGLLESAYEECLCRELELRKLNYIRQMALPLRYKGLELNCSYRMDLLVEKLVVVEIKAIDALLPIHKAQVISYLRLGGWNVGLLLNFNVVLLKNGIQRIISGEVLQ